MKFLILALSIGLCAQHSVLAKEVEGVTIPPNVTLAGKSLQLNGTAVRNFRWLSIPIRIYVAAFYTPAPLRSAKEAMASQGPLQFNFIFLRDVNQQQVTEAWQKQMAASAGITYDGYEKDRDRFVGMFGPLKTGGTQTVELIGQDTVVTDQGIPKGTIPGRNFQKAFLSMWFGENPVSDSVKSGLLGVENASGMN